MSESWTAGTNQQSEQESSARVLVVDDDPLSLKMIAFLLEDAGYTVSVVDDGEHALEFLTDHTVDLVLLDVMMPGQDGYTTCQRIRQQFDTPIIFLSAKGEPNDRILGLQLGADDYLSKPFGPAELLARVKAVIRRNAVVDSNTGAFVSTVRGACPHLGLRADPKSIGARPNSAHRCYVTGHAVPVTASHQTRFCLGVDYSLCPRYVEPAKQAAASGRVAVESLPWGRLALIAVMVTILLVGALIVWQSYPLFNATVALGKRDAAVPSAVVANTQTPTQTPMATTPTAAVRQAVGSLAETVTVLVPTATPTETPLPATETPAATPTVLPTAIITARVALNLRSGPETTYDVITAMLKDEVVTVLGQDTTGEWLYVQLTDGRSGWGRRSFTDYTGIAPVTE